ncbi:MAG: 3-oxoacyl-[acyl-carrier-protein] synthase III C-terminal domain-containing protein, partial [Thermoplasmata archaeon]
LGLKLKDFDYAVFHQPNGKFPSRAAKLLGFKESQIKQGLIVPYIGNTYSGSMITGLSAILDNSKPGDRILATSFGSGAGSDSFHIEVTEKIEDFHRDKAPDVWKQINSGKYIDYAIYAKFKGKIKMGE